MVDERVKIRDGMVGGPRSGRVGNWGIQVLSADQSYANFVVINSLLTGNRAIGWGQNPALPDTPGGGAIYTDGNSYNLIIDGTAIRYNRAREGGGGIFCVVNNDHGTLTIEHSALHHNPSGQFQDAPGIFNSLNGHDVQPVVIDSTIN